MTRDTATDAAAHRIAQLVEREQADVLAYFARRLDVHADAADLLGETLLVVWRRIDVVPTDPTEARMWLFGVARRVLADHRRGRGRRLALSDRLRDELASRASPEHPDARVETLRDAIARLPARDRELVRLVHWEGFSLAEAATVIGVRPGTARMRYARARERLRAALE